jgi:capsular polysaccharide transport system ATP-binding protein
MIALENVSKTVAVRGKQEVVLQDVSLQIPMPLSVGVVGASASGKSMLGKLLTGTETPTSGRVVSTVRVSHPAKYRGNLQKLLSGRQNARFICRIHGHDDDLEERIERVEQICRLGAKFDKPSGGYAPAQKMRLSFALSWVLDFDVYVADASVFAGDTGFGSKAAADAQLQSRLHDAALILTAQRPQDEQMLRQRCEAGIWVHADKAQWFATIDEAIAASRGEAPSGPAMPRVKGDGKGKGKGQRKEGPGGAKRVQAMPPVLAEIRKMQQALAVLAQGAGGQAPEIEPKDAGRLLRLAAEAGMELFTTEEMQRLGLATPVGATPVLRVPGGDNGGVEYFDAKAGAAPDRAGRTGVKAGQED